MQDLKELNEVIAGIKDEICKGAETLTTSRGVYEFKKTFLDNKQGRIGLLMKEMRNVPNDQKAEFGKTINGAKEWANQFFDELDQKLKEKEQQQRYETECQADDEVQHHDVAQDVLRRLVVSLPEAHGHQRRSTHTHQRTESRGEVHQREGQRKARNGQRPYPVADEDTVDHVVERRSRHGDDRRHGILHEQLANTLRPELRRRPFYRCRHIIYYQLCPGESRTNYLTIP